MAPYEPAWIARWRQSVACSRCIRPVRSSSLCPLSTPRNAVPRASKGSFRESRRRSQCGRLCIVVPGREAGAGARGPCIRRAKSDCRVNQESEPPCAYFSIKEHQSHCGDICLLTPSQRPSRWDGPEFSNGNLLFEAHRSALPYLELGLVVFWNPRDEQHPFQ